MGRKKRRINSTLISKQFISFALQEKCNTIWDRHSRAIHPAWEGSACAWQAEPEFLWAQRDCLEPQQTWGRARPQVVSSSCYGSVYTNTHSLHQCTFSEHTVTHTHTHAIKLYKCACQHKCVKGQLIDRTTGMQMHGPACTHTYRAHNIGNYSTIQIHPPTDTHTQKCYP